VPPEATTVPIGKPIANTQVYVLDKHLEPVPVGVTGEIYIGGDGLARGYLNDAELTAERFVRHPFDADTEARLYRTGDLGRRRADGAIEFVGRLDQQIKIRGFRVELGEIEAALTAHERVREALVVPAQGARGQYRLTAYVVPWAKLEGETDSPDDNVLEHWQRIYDTVIYARQQDTTEEPTFNIAGWNSTYTHEPLPAEQMREQVNGTMHRVAALRPRRVLDIGCGTGLLLFRLAPSCEEYVGTDISTVALDFVRKHLQSAQCTHAELIRARADDLSALAGRSFDTIVLNSVIQYFPNLDYLQRVLRSLVALLGDGGHIFIGDVRNLALLEALHASLELHRAPDSLACEELQARIARACKSEQELIVDPSFFVELAREEPRITGVRVEPKRGRSDNELTAYRFDAVLRVDKPISRHTIKWHDWSGRAPTLEDVRNVLVQRELPVGIRRLPNARTSRSVSLMRALRSCGPEQCVATIRSAYAADAAAVEPEDVIALAEELHLHAYFDLSDASTDGGFDAVFVSGGPDPAGWFLEPAELPRMERAHANTPVSRESAAHLTTDLGEYMQRLLPHYMQPSEIVVLDRFPLNPNGKVDIKALPPPAGTRPELPRAFVPPSTALEQVLCGIWSDVLQIDRVGLHDSFFDLGGHSLLATRAVSRIRDALEIDLPLRRLFETLTVARLAQSILVETPDPALLARRAELVLDLSRMSEEDVDEQLAMNTAGDAG
jgi:2-polyprenyl-3-methyl-5-hydroxy-6-metoxy-1,4-benzoquinol methylase